MPYESQFTSNGSLATDYQLSDSLRTKLLTTTFISHDPCMPLFELSVVFDLHRNDIFIGKLLRGFCVLCIFAVISFSALENPWTEVPSNLNFGTTARMSSWEEGLAGNPFGFTSFINTNSRVFLQHFTRKERTCCFEKNITQKKTYDTS